MDKLIFTSLGSQQVIDRRIQQIANEIANVSTTGFKRTFAAATQAYRMDGDGFRARYLAGAIPSSRIDMSPGPMISTGNNLDIALGTNQLLVVRTANGETAYSRRGDLSVSADGTLRIGSGEQILSDANTPITVPELTELKIGSDGTVLAKQVGGEAVLFQPLARIQIVDAEPEQVHLREDGLYKSGTEQAFSAAITPEVSSGILEGSNSNLFSAMVDMISMSRRYEMQVKVLKQASDLAERSVSLAKVAQ